MLKILEVVAGLRTVRVAAGSGWQVVLGPWSAASDVREWCEVVDSFWVVMVLGGDCPRWQISRETKVASVEIYRVQNEMTEMNLF